MSVTGLRDCSVSGGLRAAMNTSDTCALRSQCFWPRTLNRREVLPTTALDAMYFGLAFLFPP